MLTRLIEFYKKHRPRNLSIWVAAVLAAFIILPATDFNVLRRFITFFLATQVLGWVVLKVMWKERTKDTDGLQLIMREASYVAIVVGGFIAAGSASL